MEGEARPSVNSELWHACAGPRVSLPCVGSLVVYFPQGHSEQVAASTLKQVDAQIPNYPNLPSQLVCQLHSVTLRADIETDEVCAEMTLQPVNDQEKELQFIPPEVGVQNRQPTEFFCKTLTASDTSTHGGFSVPRRAAEKVFPSLDFSKQPPAQELRAKDLHDHVWTFRHIYRGQPKRHLLTTGWSVFVSAKRLVAGDSVLFIRDDKGQLLLGIRRANSRQPSILPSSVLSSDSMHIGVLAAAAHASATSSHFQVFYNPRTSPSEFVIPWCKYRKAVHFTQVSVGMRFRMVFETEESTVRRYMGTVTAIGDLDAVRWPGSKWRNLEVGWDESSAGERPRRVSLWDIEPVSTPFFICPPFVLRSPKRPLLLQTSAAAALAGSDVDSSISNSNAVDIVEVDGAVKRYLATNCNWLGGENSNSSGRVADAALRSFLTSPAAAAAAAALQFQGAMMNGDSSWLQHLQQQQQQLATKPYSSGGGGGIDMAAASQEYCRTISHPQQQQLLLRLQQQQQASSNSSWLHPSIHQSGHINQQLQLQLHQAMQQKAAMAYPSSSSVAQLPSSAMTPNIPHHGLQHPAPSPAAQQQPSPTAAQLQSQFAPSQITVASQQMCSAAAAAAPIMVAAELMTPTHQQQHHQAAAKSAPLLAPMAMVKPSSYASDNLDQAHNAMAPNVQQQRTNFKTEDVDSHRPPPPPPLQHQSQMLLLPQLQTPNFAQHHQFPAPPQPPPPPPPPPPAQPQPLQRQQASMVPPPLQHQQHQYSQPMHPLNMNVQQSQHQLQNQMQQQLLQQNNMNVMPMLQPQQAVQQPAFQRSANFHSQQLLPSQAEYLPSAAAAASTSSQQQQQQQQLQQLVPLSQPGGATAMSNELLSGLQQMESASLMHLLRESPQSESPLQLSNIQQIGSSCGGGGGGQSDTSSVTSCSYSLPPTETSLDNSLLATTTTFQQPVASSSRFNGGGATTASASKEMQCRAAVEEAAALMGSFSSPSTSFVSNTDGGSGRLLAAAANGLLDEALLQQQQQRSCSSWLQTPAPVRTFTKVHKTGSVGRSIDLSRLKNYEELRWELARMFNIEGQLEDPPTSYWQLVFVDTDGDTLLVGDDPWEEFVSCVRVIKILSTVQVLQMNQEGLEQHSGPPLPMQQQQHMMQQQQTSSSSEDCLLWKAS